MIEFRCPNCSQRLVVREDRAGRISRCPRCKAKITIPQASAPEPIVETQGDELTLVAPAKPLDKAMLDLPDEQELRDRVAQRKQEEERLLMSLGIKRKPPHTGERRFPWPIDILLYPISASGLIVRRCSSARRCDGATSILRPLLGAHRFRDLPRLRPPRPLRRLYLAECIHDSALRARGPRIRRDRTWGQWSRLVYLLAVYFVYLPRLENTRCLSRGVKRSSGPRSVQSGVLPDRPAAGRFTLGAVLLVRSRRFETMDRGRLAGGAVAWWRRSSSRYACS